MPLAIFCLLSILLRTEDSKGRYSAIVMVDIQELMLCIFLMKEIECQRKMA